MSSRPRLRIRHAKSADHEQIRALIAASSRSLGADHYGGALIELALDTVLGLDTQLVQDGTYFVAESPSGLTGCGGWSRRLTLFGSDAVRGRNDRLLDPATESARIRAFFVHPDHARQGIGSRILKRCEEEARQAGFRRLELGATLSGVDFYRAHGYAAGAPYDYECAPGTMMEIVPMRKDLQARGGK